MKAKLFAQTTKYNIEEIFKIKDADRGQVEKRLY